MGQPEPSGGGKGHLEAGSSPPLLGFRQNLFLLMRDFVFGVVRLDIMCEIFS